MSEASDETEAQDGTIDAGAAMGTPADDSSKNTVPEADQTAYEDLVKRAVRMLENGSVSFDDLQPKPYHDQGQEQFRADVREKIDGGKDAGQDQSADDQSTVTTVDWGALWDEFGMDTPDSIGTRWMCRPKLETAVQCSEQGVTGAAGDHIDDAIEDGVLQAVHGNNDRLRGYVYAGGEA